jgi:RimJ/RimL family protein N-acetyltransferase
MTPVLQTQRLTLRGHVMADFEPYAAAFATDRFSHMGAPLSRDKAWACFCRDVAQWELLGHGAWAIALNETGAFIGQVGINGHPYFPENELGWLVMPEAEGRGFAQEAAAAARDWAFRTLGLTSLVSYIAAGNTRSIKLAERLGAVQDDEAECPYDGHLVFRHLRPEDGA